jgi:hypothetical protein
LPAFRALFFAAREPLLRLALRPVLAFGAAASGSRVLAAYFLPALTVT